MNLSEQDNLLTETSLGENVGEQDNVATDSIKADAFIEPSSQRDGETEVSVGIDKTCKPNYPLIVYTSSRRSGACSTKLNQNNECRKPSKCRTANENSDFDLSSLQILRRSRSSFSNRARSSVWGCLGNILPDFEEKTRLDLNLGNEKKISVRSGKGKKNAIRDQTGRKSIGKRCTPTGRISLKVKIGNKIFSMVKATEKFCESEKDTPELFDTVENKLGEKVPTDTGSARERNLVKAIWSDASALSTHLDARVTFDNPSFNTSNDFHQSISVEEGDNLGASFENRCSDVGTSPDSEVINSVPPGDVSSPIISQKKSKKGKKKDELHQVDNCIVDSRLTVAETTNNYKVPISAGDVSNLSLTQTNFKKGKKKDKLHEVGGFCVEKELTGAETTYNAKVPAHLEVDQKVGDISYSSVASMITTAKPHVNDPEINPGSGHVSAVVSLNSQVCDKLIPCSNGRKFPKYSRAKGRDKGQSRILDLPGKKDKASKKKGNKNNVGGKHQVNEKFGASGVPSRVDSHVAAGNQTPSDLGETRALGKDLSGPINSTSDGARKQYISTRNAWVLCDKCQKWRRIPATLADQIEETNCRWTCKDNKDKGFADCSIPQEKSNSEINEELEISDASCEEDACGTFLKSKQSLSKVARQSSWSLIKSNLFLHRSRKTQTIDEVMVCHCNPPSDGRMGCGAKCLNRMLNIECVRGTCPCGELCSNQQFQRRKYAKLKWFKCGKKGYGLQALEDISQGQFHIEYVGEVLDVHSYEARQREYALNGHKHFYFMTLNGSEVIDACAKGNLGRFINHSCDPNCRTEKWMVNGEVCVGLFSLRDIKKGEEVTFDYNYVRVFGAAARKCVCGSPNCRGYIGGDPTNSDVIVQDDSDDEYTEPVMICGDKELYTDWKEIMSNSLNDGGNEIANEPLENIYSTEKLISAAGQGIRESHTSQTLAQKVKDVNSAKVEYFVCNDSAANSVERSNINKMATVSHSESLSDAVESKRKLKYATEGGMDELAKSNSLGRTNGSSSSIKKGKPKTNTVNDKRTPKVDKLNAAVHKSKKLQELPSNSHFETVEEKLNQLLDPEGGISKRKDASRGYLKLLFLTAASGNNGHGEAIQSTRDLSMILGALLKTKSRTVLVDIINKNGLQMLHNIMKQYRKEFTKTPILRKLLKILEYLATREILTLEHITGGPPRLGVESFKDSILTLTEHADRQVHQIARNFRDRWIPKSLRKNCCMKKNDVRTEFHRRSSYGGSSVSYDHRSDGNEKPSDAINSCATQSVAASGTNETNGTKTRKRKSRWDNPVDEYPCSRSRTGLTGGDKNLKLDENTPPGFSTPCNNTVKIVLGDLHSRFVASLPVSYGISYSSVQQCGLRQGETPDDWKIALGVPFHPFPPLPPYARGDRDCPTSDARCTTLSEPAEKAERFSDTCPTRTSSSVDPPEKNVSVGNGQPDFQHTLGRKFFGQQKLNHSKLAPPLGSNEKREQH